MKAREKRIARIRATTLDQAGLTPFRRNRLVECLHQCRGTPLEYDSEVLRRAASKATIGDCIDNYDAMVKSGCHDGVLPAFRRRLIALGMNHLDWHRLGPTTITGQLERLSKKEILSLDVRVLNTFSHKALRAIAFRILGQEYIDPPGLPRVTIAEVIAKVTIANIDMRYNGSFETSFLRTHVALSRLGFGYDDGPFFQEGTVRQEIERLIARHRLSKRAAKRLVSIALAEDWIKPPLR